MPQVFVGEVMTVAEECGSADGGAPALVGPVPGTTRLPVLVALPYRDQSGLDEFLNEVSDPNSPLYRHYLTDDQLTAMFGPTVCDYDATVAWAESKGLTVVQTYPDRELLDLSAPVSIIDAVFHVTLSYYLRSDGTQFYAPDVDPSIDLSVPVLEVSGLDSCAVATPATAP